MLSELIHGGVGDAHIPEHALQFRGELTAALGLSKLRPEEGSHLVNQNLFEVSKHSHGGQHIFVSLIQPA